MCLCVCVCRLERELKQLRDQQLDGNFKLQNAARHQATIHDEITQ